MTVGSIEMPFDSRTTEQDIFNCFRLILGRNPSKEELTGHRMAFVGEPLGSTVGSYLNSLEFSRRKLLQADLSDVQLAQHTGFSIYASRSDLGAGKYLLVPNRYEPHVTAVFRRILKPGMGILDVGANVGYFSMLSASLVGSEGYVLAVEPRARNVAFLEASRRSNGFENIHVVQCAAGAEPGLMMIKSFHSIGSTSMLPDDVKDILGADTVPVFRLDDLVEPDRQIDLIKIDIDGPEYLALQGCQETIRRWHPIILSEFCPGLLAGLSGIDGPGYLRFLIDLGYSLAVIEAGGELTEYVADVAGVISNFKAKGVDHIDIQATPRQTGD